MVLVLTSECFIFNYFSEFSLDIYEKEYVLFIRIYSIWHNMFMVSESLTIVLDLSHFSVRVQYIRLVYQLFGTLLMVVFIAKKVTKFLVFYNGILIVIIFLRKTIQIAYKSSLLLCFQTFTKQCIWLTQTRVCSCEMKVKMLISHVINHLTFANCVHALK